MIFFSLLVRFFRLTLGALKLWLIKDASVCVAEKEGRGPPWKKPLTAISYRLKATTLNMVIGIYWTVSRKRHSADVWNDFNQLFFCKGPRVDSMPPKKLHWIIDERSSSSILRKWFLNPKQGSNPQPSDERWDALTIELLDGELKNDYSPTLRWIIALAYNSLNCFHQYFFWHFFNLRGCRLSLSPTYHLLTEHFETHYECIYR